MTLKKGQEGYAINQNMGSSSFGMKCGETFEVRILGLTERGSLNVIDLGREDERIVWTISKENFLTKKQYIEQRGKRLAKKIGM